MASKDNPEKKYTFYTLECEDGKYYSGRTEKNKFERFYEHHIGEGSAFTKKYKPLRIVESFESSDLFDEDKTVLRYMNLYGVDNVRGGSYSKLTLSGIELEMINKQLRNATDKCFTCGKPGHFTRDCKDQKDIPKPAKKIQQTKPRKVCERCGRNHSTNKCFVNTNAVEQVLEDSEDSGEEIVQCYRCLREGHYANRCNARTNILGEKIGYGI